MSLLVISCGGYHPVKSMIESVKWDGTPRAETIFTDYLGADDNEYVRAVAKKWLTGAVARIYEPGIKFEIVPMLVGKQGRGKSTLAAKLGGEHFNDDLKDMKSKDSKDFLQGSWIIELGELAAMKRTEVEEVKSFISAKMDRYRPSYGRITLDHPRTCVFMGTTNDLQFLKDVSGNRRFYPIPIDEHERTADVFSLEAETVQQIWAESLINYQDDEKIYMPERLERIANEYRGNATETNPMQDDIYRYLDFLLPEEWEIQSLDYKRSYIDRKLNNCDYESEGKVQRKKVTTREILTELFCRDPKEELRGQSEAKKVGLIMNNHDEWKYTSYYVGERKVKGYVRRSSLTE